LARKQTRKKRCTGATVPVAATRANQVWCLDFCHDACLNGTRLKVLAVKDEYTRECLALEVATRLNSQRVRSILQRLVVERGAPEYLRSDNGPEFIAGHLRIWLLNQGAGHSSSSRVRYCPKGARKTGTLKVLWLGCGTNVSTLRFSTIWRMPDSNST